MKFIGIRDLRNQSGVIPRAVTEETVTLTSNGSLSRWWWAFRRARIPRSWNVSSARRGRSGRSREFARRRGRMERTGSPRTRSARRSAPYARIVRGEDRRRRERPRVRTAVALRPPGRVLDLLLSGRAAALYDDRVIQEYREVVARPRLRIDPVLAGLVHTSIERDGLFVSASPAEECGCVPLWLSVFP